MRIAGNFHPEWGYLAPAPSFMRTARIALVATAIGATAGAGVVVSLLDRPAANPAVDAGKSMVVVHSLVQPAAAATAVAPVTVAAPAAPVRAQASAQAGAQVTARVSPQQTVEPSAAAIAPPPASVEAAAPAAAESGPASTPDAPAGVAALTETSPTETSPATEAAPANDEAAAAPDQAAQKKAVKKHAGNGKKKWAGDERGLAPLFRSLFSARSGPNYR